MTPDELTAARRERVRRWARAGGSLHGYPAFPPEQETAETLAAEPPKAGEKKPKPKPTVEGGAL
jgi:hypothetical protein